MHTYASALAYVDGRPQGAQPLTYAPQGIRGCGVENPQGFGIDKRRFNATNPRSSAFICGSFSSGNTNLHFSEVWRNIIGNIIDQFIRLFVAN